MLPSNLFVTGNKASRKDAVKIIRTYQVVFHRVGPEDRLISVFPCFTDFYACVNKNS